MLKSILVCPITKQHLLPVNKRLRGVLEEALAAGQLFYADAAPVVRQGDLKFLITQNNTTVYSVINDVPILLEEKQVLVPK